MLAEAMASGTAVSDQSTANPPSCFQVCENLLTVNSLVIVCLFFVSDGFTFVKRHQAALIQRLKSVEPVLEHLREQNVLCMLKF